MVTVFTGKEIKAQVVGQGKTLCSCRVRARTHSSELQPNTLSPRHVAPCL